jgi:hypothetical protein
MLLQRSKSDKSFSKAQPYFLCEYKRSLTVIVEKFCPDMKLESVFSLKFFCISNCIFPYSFVLKMVSASQIRVTSLTLYFSPSELFLYLYSLLEVPGSTWNYQPLFNLCCSPVRFRAIRKWKTSFSCQLTYFVLFRSTYQIIWIGCWFVCSDSGSVNVYHLTVNMQVIIRCVQMSNSTRKKEKTCSQWLISTGLNKVVSSTLMH